MPRKLRPVGADFADAARLRVTFAGRTAADPARVHRALAEDTAGWASWFRIVTLARPVEGAGRSRREIRLLGGARFVETVMAAEAPRRYAYRVDVTNVPGPKALLEDWRLSPAGRGTAVRWTLALDAPAPVRWVLLLARPVLGAAFRDAMRRLDGYLAAGGGAGVSPASGPSSGTR
ncbi:SRPBCC family protein [Streptomyces sp. AV19]|uniref:SRPBCC family protein n=1 Tax=Streptomyces sp. AV19 TaxID=2793068 RepID=UPI0018FEF4CE|nr:SRPBCC family protein [Streptomyces sp. AV19]MBH1937135.1 SRPBCC family protein [Streptomyces sp. AV19]MDG4533162.1 SRPBCC family protein [Streptomyces sp. AV19]